MHVNVDQINRACLSFSKYNMVQISEKLAVDPRGHLVAIIDSSDDAIISQTLDGTILSWNAAAMRIFGYRPEEILGKSILTLIPSELHHEEAEIVCKLKTGERLDHYETIRVRKSGEQFPVSISLSPIKDISGKIVAASKIARDISDRKASDEADLRLAAIVDSADDAIISKDLNGIVRTWNQGARRMFGYDAEEMIGQPILRLIPPELQYEEETILSKLRAGERIDHYETTRQRKNGERLEVSVTISPMRDRSGKIIGASKIARDISARKRVEAQLLQSEKLAATGRMAATIAHEINNPLESLINLIYLARKASPPEGKVNGFLLTAEEELERVAHIARQTLGYYRETGAQVDVHIHDLLNNILMVYNSKIIANSIQVDARFNDMRKICLSKGETLQVFSNVIANAIDAMPREGILRISTRQILSTAKEAIQIVIQDNGSGIDPQNLPKVFEPFFTTKGNVGTGIGLWVARELLEQRGGQITITSSTAPGNSGTTVSIEIPFAFPASAPNKIKLA